MIVSFPYTSVSGDRKITASQEAAGFDLIIDSGVVPGENGFAAAKVSGTLNATIAAGRAVVAGHRVTSDATETVSVDAGGAQPRIDIIALESNANTDVRAARIVVVKGTAAASPTAPDLTQTAAVYQVPLCKLDIPAGAANLNSATLTDVRLYAEGNHAHASSDVTGLTAALEGKAASSHNHAASNITSGTLAAANGGTGQASLQAARNAMGLGNTTGALPVANGGTGGTTAAAGREGLDIYVVDALPASPVTGRIYIVKRS